jgi:hypothetical protein
MPVCLRFFFPSLIVGFMFLHAVLSVDAIDMSGKHEVDLDTNIWKVRQFPTFRSFLCRLSQHNVMQYLLCIRVLSLFSSFFYEYFSLSKGS